MLKPKDFEIIKYLRNNSRQTLTQLSKKTHIPISTLYDKLKMYEKGTILKHTSLINFSNLGFDARTQILLKVNKEQRSKLQSYLSNHPSINNVYLLSNDYDYSIEGIFENVHKVRDFMDDLENSFKVIKQQIVFIAEDIRKEGFLASWNPSYFFKQSR